MKGMGTIALREIVERRMLFLLALALGLLSVLLPYMPYVGGAGDRSEARDLLAYIFSAAFTFGLAILMGASLVGRDLSEGRFGFYFARPVSGLALWAGKFSGALLTVLGTGVLVLLPATLFGGGFRSLTSVEYGDGKVLEGGLFLLLMAAMLLCLILMAHAFSVAIRSHSAWVFVDLIAFCTLALAALFIGRALAIRGALFELARLCGWLAAGVLVALMAASAVQVCQGRTDVKRGHLALSIALWSCLALCLAIIGVRASWYLDVSPAKLKRLDLSVPPQGNWVAVTGLVREKDDFYASFLVDTRTGRTIDIGIAPWREAAFSPDGGLVCWPSPTGWPWKPAWELVTMDLSAEKPQPRRTNIASDGFFEAGIFSSTGERLAYATGESISVVDTGTLKSLGSFHLPGSKVGRWWVKGHFMAPDLLRLYVMTEKDSKAPNAYAITIVEYNASSRTLTTTGHITSVEYPQLELNPGNDRLLVRYLPSDGASEGWEWAIVDGRTGALLTRLAPSKNLSLVRVGFLSDGRLALAEVAGDKVMLHLFSPDGQLLRTLDLGEGTKPVLGGEPAPGYLALTVKPLEKAPASASREKEGPRTILLVDLETGTIRREPKPFKVHPAFMYARWFDSDPACTLVPGSPSSRLFVGNDTLWELDPATGTERVVFKAGQ